MNNVNKNVLIQELEIKVLKFILGLSGDELRPYFDDLIIAEWSESNARVLNCLLEYLLQDEPDGTPQDWVISSFKPFSQIASLFMDYVPLPIGKKAIRELNYLQEERKYKQTLQNLLTKPLSEIKPALYELTKIPISAYKPKSLMQTAKLRIYERKLEAQAPSTGYPDLDKYIKGFINGHTYTLSGQTNAGKTTICLNFAYRLSLQQKTTLYFALEPENTIVDYLASIRTEKPFSDLSDEDILHENPYISVFGKDQIRKVEDLVKAIYSMPRYDLVVIDHIGYFTNETKDTTSKQADVMKNLAGLAKDRQCAILLVQHFNKSKPDKGNPENSITGSAAFKQDATEVLIVEKDTQEDEFGRHIDLGTGRILIRKTKTSGGTGSVSLTQVKDSALVLIGRGRAEQQFNQLLGVDA
jgi:KaiC/GvpD/RAD55 family RecA-like ATPase